MGNAIPEVVQQEMETRSWLYKLEKPKELVLCRKSQIQWLYLGNQNNQIFHRVIKGKLICNILDLSLRRRGLDGRI